MALVYMTSGAPARGTEIPTILHSNSPANSRNLFLDRGTKLFMIRLRYSKNFNLTGLDQGALRVLPNSVSHLVLVFLVRVLPFTQFLHLYAEKKCSRAEFLLFYNRDRLLKSADLARSLRQLTDEFLGQPVNLGSFQHLM
jgi:hypothetical protein